MAVARAAADPWATAQAILSLGTAVHFGGQTADAEPLLAEALALGRAVGDRWTVAHALEFLGVAAYVLGTTRGRGRCWGRASRPGRCWAAAAAWRGTCGTWAGWR